MLLLDPLAPDTDGMSQSVAPTSEVFDQGIPWHYGEPMREQRWLLTGEAYADLSNRGVISVSGPDRLSWLNDLTTALLTDVASGDSRTALILDPNGRVEHELHLVDDGDVCWLIVAPGAAAAIANYLRSMQFMLRVEVIDRSEDLAVVGSLAGPIAATPVAAWHAAAEFAGTGTTPAGSDRGGEAGKYVPVRPDKFPATEIIVPRDQLAATLATRPHCAGSWAWEALRVAAAVPRVGIDTDDRSLPHELGWIGPAVHLAKGCYRGQEAVARTHNMGRPPRRLVLLHLDGSAETLPRPGDEVQLADARVGRVGTVAIHHELGPIALAVVKSRTDDAATLQVNGVAAGQQPVVVSQ